MCACACMHACVYVCVCVCAGSHTDRNMIWFINYVKVQSINYYISSTCLIAFLSIYLFVCENVHLCTHTYIHTYIRVYVCVCVCVCVDALTLDEENNLIYLRLSHINT